MKRSRIAVGGWRIVGLQVALIMVTSALRGDNETTKTFPLRFKPNETSVKSLGWVQLKSHYRQRGQEPVTIEAEVSTRVQLASSDMTPTEDVEASGGLCLRYVNELDNELWMETPGEYQAWYRANFPLAGSWNHHEQMDEGALTTVQDSNFGPIKQWLWVKGPVYTLTQGAHRYLWPAPTAWCGGAGLDRIVLAPAGAPEPTGMGPTATPSVATDRAELFTNRLRLDEMLTWRLTLDQELNGGKVEVHYSHDRGKTWKTLSPGKTYTVSPKTRRLSFRVQLIRSQDGTSPRIRNMALAATLRPSE